MQLKNYFKKENPAGVMEPIINDIAEEKFLSWKKIHVYANKRSYLQQTGNTNCRKNPHFPEALNLVWRFGITVTLPVCQACVGEKKASCCSPHVGEL
jgi:hypothetical protein